jgi:hypothetical protein
VRATNGYVYPASHRAGSTSGALPMGARLRLKANVGGQDPALRTSDPNARKIFRALQKYGLIVADNGSDMYITGTFDTHWNNDILNPAFSTLTASDFEVIQLGWTPPAGAPALSAIAANPNQVVGGNSSTGTVPLTGPAPANGAVVLLSSPSSAVRFRPASRSGRARAAPTSASTSTVTSTTVTSLSATYAGMTKTATFTVNPVPAPPPPAVASLTLNHTSITGGYSVTGTVKLAAPAPRGGTLVTLASSNTAVATTPASVFFGAGAIKKDFTVKTKVTSTTTVVTISAASGGVTKTATLTVKQR